MFTNLEKIKSLYIVPRDNFPQAVLIPALAHADHFDCMMGFFTSGALREIGAGLASFVNNNENKMRLVISPHVSEQDYEAIQSGLMTSAELLTTNFERLTGSSEVSKSAIINHTLHCISYLISQDRLQVKIAMMPNALFHPKVWMITNGDQHLVAHGSANMSFRALKRNYEHISIARSWISDSENETCNEFRNEFDLFWDDIHPDAAIHDLPSAIKEKLFEQYNIKNPPNEMDYEIALNDEKQAEQDIEAEAIEKGIFNIPSWLNYTSGDFKHQGDAVAAWLESSHGILEMATGSGKTITALIAAKKLSERLESLLIVIAAPFLPLIDQWVEEVLTFNFIPVIPGNENSKRKKLILVEESLQRLRHQISKIEIIVVTHNMLNDPAFHEVIKKSRIPKLLIGDEIHNLARGLFARNNPEFFEYRLGLSATPIIQYDDDATKDLNSFWGDIVYRYTLKQAIGKCLVPYNYYPTIVYLTEEEVDKWVELTSKIKQNYWKVDLDEPDSYVKSLMKERRLIIEVAKNKLKSLEKILQEHHLDTKHALIYGTDKDPEQLNKINAIVRKLGFRYAQITSQESGKPLLVQDLFEKYQSGQLQLLTAKRVLDEGVNIPEISTAFILASTTIERQWVQRRGRVLRKCSKINKTHSDIYDFIALPPPTRANVFGDAKKIVTSELKRVLEFSKLALNSSDPDGPYETIKNIAIKYYGGE